MSKILVILPVYNEEGNLKELITQLIALKYLDILVIDEKSTDQTLNIVNRLKDSNSKIFVIADSKRNGRGTAVKRGYLFAIEKGYDYVIEMDADFSHRPEDILPILTKKNSADIIIGSRLINGGRIERRSGWRNLLTKLGNLYLRWVLNLRNINDITSGFRCINVDWLKKIDMLQLKAKGPQALQEILYKNKDNVNIKEVPIIFKERYKDKSKFKFRTILESLYLPLTWKVS